MTARAEALRFRNGSAALPTFSAAMPTAIAITRICRTLKLTAVVATPSVTVVLAPRPRKFFGNRPVRKAHQSPDLPAYLASWLMPVSGAGLQQHAQADADQHGDQRGDGEPEQRVPGQPGGVGDGAQVGDGADDGGEDEGHDGGLQQRDVARADGLQRGAEGVGVRLGAARVLGQQAKAQAHDQGGDDLEAERAGPFGQLEAGLSGGCGGACLSAHRNTLGPARLSRRTDVEKCYASRMSARGRGIPGNPRRSGTRL